MEVHAKEHDERTRAILKLKKSTEIANAQMQGKTAKKKARERKIEEKQKREFDAILADGRNPYEEFRRRKQQAKLKADKKKLIEKEIKNKNEIARKMIKEEIHFVKEDKIVREHAKFADVYRASLGRHVTEERTKAYMENMTKTGSDFVIRPVACSALKGRNILPSLITPLVSDDWRRNGLTSSRRRRAKKQ